MIINVAIVDDEVNSIERIEQKVRKYITDKQVNIDKYDNPDDFLNSNKIYHMVFLDIMLNAKKDGLDVAEQYKYINFNVFIILVSSYEEYLLDGFKVNTFRVVVKNSEREESRYKEAIESALRIMEEREITIEFDVVHAEKVKIPMSAIKYISNEKRNIKVYTIEDSFVAKGTVKLYSKWLEKMNFVCSHESYLVNLDWVERIDDENVILKNNEKIPLSRKQKPLINKQMRMYKARYKVIK